LARKQKKIRADRERAAREDSEVRHDAVQEGFRKAANEIADDPTRLQERIQLQRLRRELDGQNGSADAIVGALVRMGNKNADITAIALSAEQLAERKLGYRGYIDDDLA
jgi:hypothetical protein